MDGDAGLRISGCKDCFMHMCAVHAFASVAREQGRVDIDDAVVPLLYEPRTENEHPSQSGDDPRFVSVFSKELEDALMQASVICFAALPLLFFNDGNRHVRCLCFLNARTVRAISHKSFTCRMQT